MSTDIKTQEHSPAARSPLEQYLDEVCDLVRSHKGKDRIITTTHLLAVLLRDPQVQSMIEEKIESSSLVKKSFKVVEDSARNTTERSLFHQRMRKLRPLDDDAEEAEENEADAEILFLTEDLQDAWSSFTQRMDSLGEAAPKNRAEIFLALALAPEFRAEEKDTAYPLFLDQTFSLLLMGNSYKTLLKTAYGTTDSPPPKTMDPTAITGKFITALRQGAPLIPPPQPKAATPLARIMEQNAAPPPATAPIPSEQGALLDQIEKTIEDDPSFADRLIRRPGIAGPFLVALARHHQTRTPPAPEPEPEPEPAPEPKP